MARKSPRKTRKTKRPARPIMNRGPKREAKIIVAARRANPARQPALRKGTVGKTRPKVRHAQHRG